MINKNQLLDVIVVCGLLTLMGCVFLWYANVPRIETTDKAEQEIEWIKSKEFDKEIGFRDDGIVVWREKQ